MNKFNINDKVYFIELSFNKLRIYEGEVINISMVDSKGKLIAYKVEFFIDFNIDKEATDEEIFREDNLFKSRKEAINYLQDQVNILAEEIEEEKP